MHVKVDRAGRIVIPAPIRKKFGIAAGSVRVVRCEHDGIVLMTREQSVVRVQKRLRKYVPGERCLSQELLDDRREEAAREAAKCDRWLASARKKRE
jgi:AbrB family looped-hinge helix DNA binding protein